MASLLPGTGKVLFCAESANERKTKEKKTITLCMFYHISNKEKVIVFKKEKMIQIDALKKVKLCSFAGHKANFYQLLNSVFQILITEV
jgi:hypothetical protein